MIDVDGDELSVIVPDGVLVGVRDLDPVLECDGDLLDVLDGVADALDVMDALLVPVFDGVKLLVFVIVLVALDDTVTVPEILDVFVGVLVELFETDEEREIELVTLDVGELVGVGVLDADGGTIFKINSDCKFVEVKSYSISPSLPSSPLEPPEPYFPADTA